MTDISAIIERLEKASGGDRELDGDIHNALFGTSYFRAPSSVTGFFTSRNDNGCPMVPAYTASLDAAIALVEAKLPDAEWLAIYNPRHLDGKGCTYASVGQQNVALQRKKVPAVALCLALFRALAQGGE